MLLSGPRSPLSKINSVRNQYHRLLNTSQSSTHIRKATNRTFTTEASYQQLLRTCQHLPLLRRHAVNNRTCLLLIADSLISRGLRQSTYALSTTCRKGAADNGVEELADGSNGTVSSSAGITKVIKWSEIDLDGKEKISIENAKFIASYNSTKREEPTIYVPGGPALWTPPELPFTLEARTDTRKTTPGIPPLSVQWHHIFTPLQVMQPGYSLNPVSVVSTATMIAECCQFLRKFSFPNFTLHATAEQGTLFLRKQLPVRAQQNNSPVPKFISSRHQLQKLCFKYPTTLEETHRHHRLIEYDIAGTKWLIDNSADGYQPGLDTLTIESIPSDRDPDAAPDITHIGHYTVIKAGFLVPQESLMIVRSAANHSKQTINSSTAGALFSQIPKMVLVKHNRGTIKSFLHINQFPNTLRQQVLRQLLILLREIKEAAEACESGTCRIVLRKENLDKFEMDILPSANEGTFLTDDIKDRFWSKDGNAETATHLDTEA